MQYYRFLQKNNIEEPEWLHSQTDCFSLADEDGTAWLYIPLTFDNEAKDILTANPFLIRYEPVELEESVDWGTQWADHAPDFRDDFLHVDLSKYTSAKEPLPTLYLRAGPGFGDLSHPTTRLTLAMMAPHVKGADVIDIGCGSGILSLAAILLGAKSACGIDIDDEALSHSRENAILNGLEEQITFIHTTDMKKKPAEAIVFLINMIRSQQNEAWSSLAHLHDLKGICISSGVLKTERDAYLEECSQRGWLLLEEQQQDDWMAFQWKIGDQSVRDCATIICRIGLCESSRG
jgi:ribosomal protein L11 methyltransferase